MPNIDPQNLLSDAISAISSNSFDKARKKAQQIIKVSRTRPDVPPGILSDAQHVLGVVELKLKNYKPALRFFKEATSTFDNADAYNSMSLAYFALEDADKAIDCANKAIRLKSHVVTYYVSRGKAEVLGEKWDEAISTFNYIIANGEMVDVGYYNLGRIHRLLGNDDAAIDAFKKAIAANHLNVDPYFEYKAILTEKLDYQGGIDILHKLEEAGVIYDRLFMELSILSERLNLVSEAKAYAAKALKISPRNVDAIISLAQAEVREKNYEGVIRRLKPLLKRNISTHQIADAHFLIAEAYDKLQETDNAFAMYTRGNQFAGKQVANLQETVANSRQVIQQRLKELEYCSLVEDSKAEQPDDDTQYVFMVGFPRSGTTLLGRMLDLHSKISVFHEEESLSNILRKLKFESPDSIPNPSPADVHQEYAQHVSEMLGGVKPHTVVDKMPLSLILANVIKQAFPRAKFIVSIRHPFDACLSCFMQNFGHKPAMNNFMNIRTTFEYYVEVMNSWNVFVDSLELDVKVLRYEDLLDAPEQYMRELFSFMNLEWEAEVLDQKRRENAGELINTPSYRQVGKKLNKSAVMRWKRYEKYLAEYRPLLQPFIEQYGYTLD